VIDLEGRTVELTPRQGFTVPKGAMDRTRAPERTVILMIEGIPCGSSPSAWFRASPEPSRSRSTRSRTLQSCDRDPATNESPISYE
jgi:hypothetical protein